MFEKTDLLVSVAMAALFAYAGYTHHAPFLAFCGGWFARTAMDRFADLLGAA